MSTSTPSPGLELRGIVNPGWGGVIRNQTSALVQNPQSRKLAQKLGLHH